MKKLILKLFNHCLDHGVYPWSESITTPIHKNGDLENPDNYRAITLGSCVGKLFASALLERLISYREIHCPDPPNQLGFCRGSQTSEHILTLKTVIEKYVTYSCFIDYRKVFDRVCREALICKLSDIGIKGPFFECIQNMYSNSTTHIKLIKKVSAAINVEVGTEQGHPMPPEVFKIFINDLSVRTFRSLGFHHPFPVPFPRLRSPSIPSPSVLLPSLPFPFVVCIFYFLFSIFYFLFSIFYFLFSIFYFLLYIIY